MSEQALEGLKVLDFCWIAAGPMTTKYLSEYGATVVRVESTKRPGSLRLAAPFKDGVSGINRSGYFANYNANKYGITIDMGHPRARDLILQLVSWADLVTDSFTPGMMERWGLGYTDLKEVNPRIVMFSTSMLGRGGTIDTQPGFGAVLSSLAGFTNITGWPDRGPVNPYGAYTDFIAPKFAIAAILSALDYQRRTGRGLHLDMSQLESALHFTAPMLLDYAVNDREPELMGNRHPSAAPHGVFPCQGDDRWIAIACFNDEEWQSLCRAMDPPSADQLAQERFATQTGRKANEDDLDRIIAQWTSNWESAELMTTLQSFGVAAGKVNDCRDLYEDPQLKHRGHFQYLEHPEMGRYASDTSEWRLSQTPGNLHRAAPMIGQDTEYVLKEFIGLTEDEYQSLSQDGLFV